MFVKANPIHRGRSAVCSLCRAGAFLTLLLVVAPEVHAQRSDAADPDYSNVKDILQGRRTLLSVNDLGIGGTVLKTSDDSKVEHKNISELPGFQRQPRDPGILTRL